MQGMRPQVPESHAHGVLGLILLLFGAGLGYVFTPALSGLLALVTLYCGYKFVKWRVDPLDMFFWMKSKPSWAATGMTWLCGLLLLGITYFLYKYVDHGFLGPYLANRI
ncbi:MAG: hypothetical protein KGJ23_10455 [Euryarchaeota archaeon]|nr:hypothetical protein [Euryarchaeota archaeon]MDE1837026.1 hypothetical protein [Euryarchaeota archaeon]MDE1879876.1 hypothetical protein [Euryarchaeota archaeon]MDE2045684.1 hypothetical protein [Thermoplasmata archaeon]